MKTLQVIPIPVASRLLRGITREEASRLFDAVGARAVSFSRGERIIRPGDGLDRYWLLVSGEAHAYINHGAGKRIVASVAWPGDVFGLLFAYTGLETHPTSVVAARDSVAISIPVLDPHSGVAGVPQELCLRFVSNMMAVMSRAAFRARFRAYVVSYRTIHDRVLAYLCRKSKLVCSYAFEIPFDRQEMADFLDVDRSVRVAQNTTNIGYKRGNLDRLHATIL